MELNETTFNQLATAFQMTTVRCASDNSITSSVGSCQKINRMVRQFTNLVAQHVWFDVGRARIAVGFFELRLEHRVLPFHLHFSLSPQQRRHQSQTSSCETTEINNKSRKTRSGGPADFKYTHPALVCDGNFDTHNFVEQFLRQFCVWLHVRIRKVRKLDTFSFIDLEQGKCLTGK